jgi:GTP-binding protein
MVMQQGELAIEEADLVLLLMDGAAGITSLDEALVEKVRRSGKPLLLAVNKIDAPSHATRELEFHRLGVEPILSISAEHGEGMTDLLDGILARIPEQPPLDEVPDALRIAVVGRPNVGKSSLVNRLLGYDRVLVSETPGTTRDAIDTAFDYEGRQYVLVDTAGIRRKSRILARIEKYSVVIALRSLDRCDVALVVIDATQPMTDQDARIAALADERGRAIILLLNKWDLVEKDDRTAGQVAQRIKSDYRSLAYAPVMTISAKTGQRFARILPVIDQVATENRRRLPTAAINETFERALATAPPSGGGRRAFRVAYATQAGTRPPTFIIFGKGRKEPGEDMRRYFVNRLREEFGFVGTPVRVIFRQESTHRTRPRKRAAGEGA